MLRYSFPSVTHLGACSHAGFFLVEIRRILRKSRSPGRALGDRGTGLFYRGKPLASAKNSYHGAAYDTVQTKVIESLTPDAARPVTVTVLVPCVVPVPLMTPSWLIERPAGSPVAL